MSYKRWLHAILIVALLGGMMPTLFVAPPPVLATGASVPGTLNDWDQNAWLMSGSLGGTFVYTSGQIIKTNSIEEFKFYNGGWYGNGSLMDFGDIYDDFSDSVDVGNSSFSHTQDSYYVFKWDGNARGVVFQFSGAPVDVAAVNRSSALPGVNQTVIITATTDAEPPSEQAVWLRYAINDDWSSSTVVKMTGSDTTYTTTISAQSEGTTVTYYVFTSGDVTSIEGNDADLMTITYDTNNGDNYRYTVGRPARALWLNRNTIAWDGIAGNSYRLLFDPDGDLLSGFARENPCNSTFTDPCYISLTADGTINGFDKNPNATGMVRLTNELSISDARALLKGQVAVASYHQEGFLLDISGVQIQSVLDDLYAANAVDATLGVTYTEGITPTVHVWAPTAKSVELLRFADPSSTTHEMTLDEDSGVWSVSGHPDWDRHFYLFDVEVYVPEEDAVVNNIVTDPYAVSLSTDSLRSQFVNLDDADLKPDGWDTLVKPELEHFTDITIYEMHVRDFSINDSTVAQEHRGTYVAFTYDGNYHPLSDGMRHLLDLQDAGLTHVHLLPVFDIASVPEDVITRTVWPAPTSYARDSEEPQRVISDTRAIDGFNWGYDPYHFGVPEGSYSTDPDGVRRIIEFRQMVQALNAKDLRVVMDVVYNHTWASGQHDQSVFDKIVPGYYYRYDNAGVLQHSSCCPDTATEYAMMEKLMIDTLVRFATDYKIDGFRFDLMNLHTRRNMENVRDAIAEVDPDIYLYGEGWTFGSAQDKGLTDCTDGWCFADKYNMTGAGIGLFNDIIRDAAHGGYDQDPLQIRRQGFINGLSFDWNGYYYGRRSQGDLHAAMDTLRSALRGSGDDWNGHGAPFAAEPYESMPYISKHDNETLFDQNVFKMPAGVTREDRIRAQNVGLSLMTLSQGVPFIHMGSDILRSKSLDRNSYDSGDWFNRVYWDYSHNNFGVGLPPTWENEGRWDIMRPLLADADLDPTQAEIEFAAAQFRELLRIRYSSPLFRLQSRSAIRQNVVFFNDNNAIDGLLVMGLLNHNNLDPDYETILVFFNADKQTHTFAIEGATEFELHPVHTDGVDDDPVITGGASFANGTFTIPARTTVVFVSPQTLAPPVESSIDWVGDMSPVGGESAAYDEGTGEHDVYVQVYKEGVTGSANGSDGSQIACYLHWGRYGEVWADAAMTFNAGFDTNPNNDEYMIDLDVSGLSPGIYGYTAYCTDDGGMSKRWRSGEDGLIAIVPADDPTPAPPGGVFVHLFEWSWTDIAQECAFLGEKGYTAVQVSPPQEHILGDPWWTRYQPVSYEINSRSGDLAQFQAMIDTCAAAGVDIYVDAVVNHMTGAPDPDITYTGTAGTEYRKYHYPYPEATLFGPENFNAASGRCPTDSGEIEGYTNRQEVQYCELLGLDDLNYDLPDTVEKVQAYLNDLIAMGVTGFRIDAAKHMFAYDLERLYAGLDDLPGGGRPYLFQEVIGAAGEPVKEFEYFYMGDVTEFEATNSLGWFFSDHASCGGTLSGLESYGGAGYMPERFAQVFVNNHDNQRGHATDNVCIVTYKNGAVHDLANVFMLAHPYGHPSVMSSYYFATDSQGPPATGVYVGGEPVGCNATDWVCEHRAPAVANMVQFRQATHGADLTHWQVIAPDHIAFGRGDQGFVAINRTGSQAPTTYQTGLPAGTYCDVISGGRATDGATCAGIEITVNADGEIVDYTLGAMSAFAIIPLGTPELSALQAYDVALEAESLMTATLRTHDGLAVRGQTVTFTLESGAGNLSALTASTDHKGVAVITYTAPNTLTVAVVSAAYTDTSGLPHVALTSVYVGYRAEVTELVVEQLPTDDGAAISLGGILTVTKHGDGAPFITLAIFDSNPQTRQTGIGAEKSAFVDIYLPNAAGIASLTVTLACNASCGAPDDAVWWGNPVTGEWLTVTNASVAFFDNRVTFTLTGTSTPRLADLQGTPFVVSRQDEQPTTITLHALQATSLARLPLALLPLTLAALLVTHWHLRREEMLR